MVNFPGSLDSLANPTGTTKRNDPGFELHTVISTLNDIAEALEAKQGIGATTPDAIYKTIMATAAGTSGWGYNTPVLFNEQIVSGSPAADISVTGIPATFRHIEVRMSSANSAGIGFILMRLSTAAAFDTGANYDYLQTFFDSTGEHRATGVGQTSMQVAAHSNTANIGYDATIRLNNYRSGLHKAVHTDAAYFTGTTAADLYRYLFTGKWRNTGVIDGIRLTPSAGSFAVGSVVSTFLYP